MSPKNQGNDTTILSDHPYFLWHFANDALIICVACIGARAVEGSGVGSAGCVVHVDVHQE